jgi:transcription initiation factor IIF auxiliary subunit
MKVILENYPIRKTQGESNGWGNFEIEIIESLFFIEKEKSNNYYNLKIIQNFDFEENIEKDSSKSIEALNRKKEAKEIEIIKYNGEKYDFKKFEYKFLKGY